MLQQSIKKNLACMCRGKRLSTGQMAQDGPLGSDGPAGTMDSL